MKFLVFECIRISRKWNISAALQSKCIMGCQGGIYHSFVSRGAVILGRHLFWLWVFSCFVFLLLLLFGNVFLSITFFKPTRVDALEFCRSVGWAIYSLSNGACRDFLPTFSPTGFFFRQVFFWPPSDSRVNCLLTVSFALNRILRSCTIGCCITCHYSYWCAI